jgi:D,D-heptose 1,7-bisphosphate phosphatase
MKLSASTLRPAIFFDRDGTLIVDHPYQHRADAIEYLPGYFELMRLLTQKSDFLLFVVTNQSGVARGYFPAPAIMEIHEQMNADLQRAGLRPFDDIRYCPHLDSDLCLCRKPRPGMLVDLATKWSVDLERSVMVGDRVSDVEAGQNAKVKHPLLLDPKSSSQINLTSIPNLFELADYLSTL